jgi:5-methylcytosine-specific restriction endonuclease McrA
MSTRIDLAGRAFGRLTVLRPENTVKGQLRWLCRCICGNEKVIYGGNLTRRGRRGITQSCGCLKQAPPKNKVHDRIEAVERNRYTGSIVGRSRRVLKLPVGLTFDEYRVMIHEPCHYCGDVDSGQTGDNMGISETTVKHNGIDRIDSDLGYTLENCVPCCRRCNLAKNDMGRDDFLLWISRVYEHLKRQNAGVYNAGER